MLTGRDCLEILLEIPRRCLAAVVGTVSAGVACVVLAIVLLASLWTLGLGFSFIESQFADTWLGQTLQFTEDHEQKSVSAMILRSENYISTLAFCAAFGGLLGGLCGTRYEPHFPVLVAKFAAAIPAAIFGAIVGVSVVTTLVGKLVLLALLAAIFASFVSLSATFGARVANLLLWQVWPTDTHRKQWWRYTRFSRFLGE